MPLNIKKLNRFFRKPNINKLRATHKNEYRDDKGDGPGDWGFQDDNDGDDIDNEGGGNDISGGDTHTDGNDEDKSDGVVILMIMMMVVLVWWSEWR